MIVENITCKLDKMPEGSLTSINDARICDVGTETASTITARYHKGIGAHKDNMCIVAMRGRNPENPSDRTVGSPTEQRLEPNSQGICNTLTSVQKDNLVMEKVCYIDEQNMNARNDVVGTLTTDGSSPKHNNRVLETVRIKQATKEGYIECKVGGVADLLYPSSTTRRGRVQDNGDVSPTITSMENGLYKIEKGNSYEEGSTIEILQLLRKEVGEEDFCEWAMRGLFCILQEEVLRQNLYAKSIYQNWTHRPELFKFAFNSKGNQYSTHSEKAMRNMWEEWNDGCTPQGRGLSEQQSKQLDDFVQKLPYEATQKKKYVYCMWKASEGIGILQQALSEIQEVWESTDCEQRVWSRYRIRKLTEKECWRLMDFSDEDFNKAAENNSRTQLYKQAGNSIVKNVLVAIFGQMIPGKENVYKEINREEEQCELT